MTDFHVEAVRVRNVQKHPNADTLSIADAGGYPVIFQTGTYNDGDLAAYVPVDAVVPDSPEWAFLGGNRRIKAKRLRGIFSMGLLTKAPDGANEGDDLAEALGVVKYEPAEHGGKVSVGTNEAGPVGWDFVKYTDIEPLRRWSNVIGPGVDVVLTEKIHGANARFCHDGERLWVGSRTQIKRHDGENTWSQVATQLDLETKLANAPRMVFFGEVFGNVQDLKYGIASGATFRCFDVFSVDSMRYLNHEVARWAAQAVGVEWVPELYRGPWVEELRSFADGSSTLASHVREGFVVKPLEEIHHGRLGRVILKHVGEGYLLRKVAK